MSATASADLLRLLAAIAESPSSAHADYARALGLAAPATAADWQVAHTMAFIEQCPPFASTMLGEGGQIGGAAAARVADFRALLGAEVETAPPDVLPALLADYAELVERAASDARAAHARAAMLWEHLLSWVMPYLDAVNRSAPAPYDGWATLMRDVLLAETQAVAPPDLLPLQLRMAPPALDLAHAESVDAAVRALLVPAASGIVLTRVDLTRAVIALEAGLIQNSRAFALGQLVTQDAPATLDWLAAEARDQAIARMAEIESLGVVGQFWADRAHATAEALDDLARVASARRVSSGAH
ncbi:molecular chaperone TorD family protein [Salinisphaera hydrothermalis]|uniref:Uncharacterized protein n=1 Tax=Salinisphaera hydrothermalis (strain C41B8) TaxID=1304275 RepID=A0A084IGG4_SALHC|nr:molecular chaperone TorD family protein [Salinisphaera hydrothermalis]KEZ75798.1 hypothetical protein C41B8_18191 [Salinisphaera hydrothermalis C41B8]